MVYEEPEITVVKLACSDVILASFGDEDLDWEGWA